MEHKTQNMKHVALNMEHGTLKRFFGVACSMLYVIGSLTLSAVPAHAVIQAQIDASKSYQSAYVPCGYTVIAPAGGAVVNGKTYKAGDKYIYKPCGFPDVLEFARRAIVGSIGVGALFAAIGFAYAGLLYITAAGSQEKISHAHSIFVKVAAGLAIMLGAWLIAKTLEIAFLTEPALERSFLEDCKGVIRDGECRPS